MRKIKKIGTWKDKIWLLWKWVFADSCCDGYGMCAFLTHIPHALPNLTFILFTFHFVWIYSGVMVAFFCFAMKIKRKRSEFKKVTGIFHQINTQKYHFTCIHRHHVQYKRIKSSASFNFLILSFFPK